MKYVTKPVAKEAFRLGYDTNFPRWYLAGLLSGVLQIDLDNMDPPYLFIKTLEGTMRAAKGDWIIQGLHGEIYACSHEVFQATYEEWAPTIRDLCEGKLNGDD